MILPSWHEEPISKGHDRASFDCGDAELNVFLQRYARQSHEAGGAKTFLAIDDTDNQTVLGFYSIAPGSLSYAATPELVRRGLAKHDVPGFRLARLATHAQVQGQGLGGQLLGAIGRRCIRVAAEVGGVMLIIDAKNDRAARWYASYGAVPLRNKPLTLALSLSTLERELRAANALRRSLPTSARCHETLWEAILTRFPKHGPTGRVGFATYGWSATGRTADRYLRRANQPVPDRY